VRVASQACAAKADCTTGFSKKEIAARSLSCAKNEAYAENMKGNKAGKNQNILV